MKLRGIKIRCLCCNRNLNDIESTRRHAVTNEFLDICNRCIIDTEIPYIDREDLHDTLEDDEAEDEDYSLPEVPGERQGYDESS